MLVVEWKKVLRQSKKSDRTKIRPEKNIRGYFGGSELSCSQLLNKRFRSSINKLHHQNLLVFRISTVRLCLERNFSWFLSTSFLCTNTNDSI